MATALYTPADLANKSYVAKMTSSQRDSALAWAQGQVAIDKKFIADQKIQYDATSQALNAAAANAAKAQAAFEKNPTNVTLQANNSKAQAAVTIKKAELGGLVSASAGTSLHLASLEQGISNLKKANAVANPAVQPKTNSNKKPVVAAVPSEAVVVRPATTVSPTIAIPPVTQPYVDPAPGKSAIQEQKLIDAENAVNAQNLAIENARLAIASNNRGLTIALENTRSQATQQDTVNFQQEADWRVRLALAPGSTYLYKDPQIYQNESILLPLLQTDGVVFPYTPELSVAYSANYAPTDVTHSNYTIYSYTNSKVAEISIKCDFTAQDTFEAGYLLAVIHFFRSATKMFYGQDQNPRNGTPPPLCYLTGLGAFQFDQHPLAITGFNYTLPTDVDYIRAGIPSTEPGVNKAFITPKNNSPAASGNRPQNNGLNPGGGFTPPKFNINYSTKTPTYVPTKITLSISAIPIVTRNDISNNFSLSDYATGKLLRGSRRPNGGGIW
jgi:hypothetical protein